MADGKAADLQGIVLELIKLAGIAARVALAKLFNNVWNRLLWPAGWQLAFMIPLFKDSVKMDPNNYRLLAIGAVVPKIFEKILDIRLRRYLERTGKLSDLQGGFRESRGTVDQIFILNEIVSKRLEEKMGTALCFLDVRKAYDRVWRAGLFLKLSQLGIGGRFLAMLRIMFRRVSRTILVNDSFTEEFDVHTGVPQGSVLSPLLYAVYVNGLHDALREHGLGVRIYGRLVPLLLYADDIVLLACNAVELQRMLRVVSDYAYKWRFEVNHGKSGVVACGGKQFEQSISRCTWYVAGGCIRQLSQYKYLGVEFGTKAGLWKALLTRLLAKATRKMNHVLCRSGGRSGLGVGALAHLWKAEVVPILEYASEVWEGGQPKTWTRKFESLQYAFARSILGFSPKSRPAAAAVLAELGLSELKTRREAAKLRYWHRLHLAASHRLLHVIFRHRHSEALSGGAKLSSLRFMRTTLLEHDLRSAWLGDVPAASSAWRSLTLASMSSRRRTSAALLISQKSSLVFYAQLGTLGATRHHPYLDDFSNPAGTLAKTRLRLGMVYLMDRVASLLGWPVSSRVCPLCHAEVEDVRHYVQRCVALELCRRKFFAVVPKPASRVNMSSISLHWVATTSS
jgi:hypothetical protein